MSQAGRMRYFARSATRARSARRGEVRHEPEARDEGEFSPPRLALRERENFPSSRASRSCRTPREISRSPRLAHKAPVMQASVGGE